MNFILSAKEDIENWAALGNPGWDWSSFSSSLKKTYAITTPTETQNDGAIPVTLPEETAWSKAWRETFAGLGFPTDLADPSTGTMVGAVMHPDAIHPVTKTRSYVGSAYLVPARERANLTIWTQTLVEKVLFDKTTGGDEDAVATGVQYTTKDGETKTVAARKEVILSAGTLNSPRILELSGVGDASLLKSLGIDVVVDNKHVGENLQNHPMCVMCFEVSDDLGEGFETLDALLRGDPAAIGAAVEAYSKQAGPFSKSNVNAMGHVPFSVITKDGDSPDVEKVLSSLSSAEPELRKTTPEFTQAHRELVRSMLTSSTAASGYYLTMPGWGFYDPKTNAMAPAPAGSEKYFTVGMILAHPLSRGSVHIGAASASDPKLAVDFNLFAHPADVEVFAHHARFIESTLVTAEPLAGLLKVGGKRSPYAPAGPRGFSGEDGLEKAREFVRDTAVAANHQTSSCAMMPREMGGVVDSQLRVYGTKNLRVVDSSVIPLVPRCNIMATVYGVAERAAELIKSGL